MLASWKARCASLFALLAAAGCANLPAFTAAAPSLCPHRSIEPTAGSIVVACVDGTYQAFDRTRGRVWTLATPADYVRSRPYVHRDGQPATYGPPVAVAVEGGLVILYAGYGVQLRRDHVLRTPRTLWSSLFSFPTRSGLAVLQGDRFEVWAPGLAAPRFSAPAFGARDVVLSEDGRFLMTYTEDSPETPVRVFDASGEIARYPWSKDYFRVQLLSGGIVRFEGEERDTGRLLIEAGAGGELHRAPTAGAAVQCLAAGDFELFMQVTSQGAIMHLWNMRTGDVRQIHQNLSCAPKPDQSGFVILNSSEGRLELLDPVSMERAPLQGNVFKSGHIEISEDGAVALVQGSGGAILQSLAGGPPRQIMPDDARDASRRVHQVAANGSVILAEQQGSRTLPDGRVENSRALLAGFLADRPLLNLGEVNAYAMSRDGSVAVVASADGHVRAWDLSTGQATDLGSLGAVSRIDVSPDGAWAVVQAGDRSLLIRRW